MDSLGLFIGNFLYSRGFAFAASDCRAKDSLIHPNVDARHTIPNIHYVPKNTQPLTWEFQ